MTFADLVEQERDYYDLLELRPDATLQEIRTAYLRVKSAYKKDSPALYTLISEAETEDLLRRIEEAYQVLSNPDRRKDYDRNHGVISSAPEPSRPGNVISIDRAPPMEDLSDDLNALVSPKTDFSSTTAKAHSTSSTAVFEPNEHSFPFLPTPFAKTPISVPAQDREAAQAAEPKPAGSIESPDAFDAGDASENSSASAARQPSSTAWGDSGITSEIEAETEWRGTFIRKIREARGVPIEELSDFTKISRTYLLAIEDENYGRLPAAVYLRGFLTQVAKYLKLPHERVTAAYIARHRQAMIDKENGKTR